MHAMSWLLHLTRARVAQRHDDHPHFHYSLDHMDPLTGLTATLRGAGPYAGVWWELRFRDVGRAPPQWHGTPACLQLLRKSARAPPVDVLRVQHVVRTDWTSLWNFMVAVRRTIVRDLHRSEWAAAREALLPRLLPADVCSHVHGFLVGSGRP